MSRLLVLNYSWWCTWHMTEGFRADVSLFFFPPSIFGIFHNPTTVNAQRAQNHFIERKRPKSATKKKTTTNWLCMYYLHEDRNILQHSAKFDFHSTDAVLLSTEFAGPNDWIFLTVSPTKVCKRRRYFSPTALSTSVLFYSLVRVLARILWWARFGKRLRAYI